MLREGGATVETCLTRGFHLTLARAPRPQELAILARAHERALREFQADPEAAKQLLQTGETRSDTQLDPAELAACTTVASTLLSLDATITRE